MKLQASYSEYCKIFKNNFFYRTRLVAALSSCVCFDRMYVEHMQIGRYRCNNLL